eukprot:3553377-Pyramimonas_sp.AAC.1
MRLTRARPLRWASSGRSSPWEGGPVKLTAKDLPMSGVGNRVKASVHEAFPNSTAHPVKPD